MKYQFTKEDKAVKRLKITYPDIIIYEDDRRGYYLDHIPIGFNIVDNVYQLVDIKSENEKYIDEDHTLPILFQDNDQFFIIVLSDNAFYWELMVNSKRIFINHSIKKFSDG